jgi:hypothetical protein
MNLTANRLASFAVALWCVAHLYQRGGGEPALLGAAGASGLLAIIWFNRFWAHQLQHSRAARQTTDRNVPPLAINLIGWLLLMLYCAGVGAAPALIA